MSTLETVANKLKKGEAISAVQYVRLEHFSEKKRDRIMSDNGTRICRNILNENPNITLAEKPYIDRNFSTRDLADREELVKMFIRLEEGDINLVLVDDIHELASSFADAITTEDTLFGDFDVVVLDLKHGVLYDSAMEFKEEFYLKMMIDAYVLRNM